MQFSSFSEFINMGGHGFYVWLSYGVAATLIGLLIVLSLNKNKSIIKQIRQRQQRELKLKQAAERQQQLQNESEVQEVNS